MLFFLRFWRKTTDRLFLFFAIAFVLLGLKWTALAFILILYAIYEENRAGRSATRA